MFNSDFYPTPKWLTEKMLENVNLNMINTILEPSAGKGDIVDVLKEKEVRNDRFSSRKIYDFNIDCIEYDSDLAKILVGKNYRVIYNDFLNFNTYKEYDLIIMNPPFSDGVKHLLKAIELQERNGGAIICLLNAETLKNQYSNDRKALYQKLIDNNANIEYIKDAFSDAERKTNVEIALIKVKFEEKERKSILLDSLQKDELKEDNEEKYESSYQVAENDFFKTIIKQYNFELKAGKKIIDEYIEMSKLIPSCFKRDEKTGEIEQCGASILQLDLSSNRDKYNSKLSINNYVKEVRNKFWSMLFNNPLFVGKLTENLRNEYKNKITELVNYDFNMYNIIQIKNQMTVNVAKGIEDTIIKLFDDFSYKGYYDEYSNNIHYYNGWKTNKSWYINNKVIIPLNSYNWIGSYEIKYGTVYDKLSDIEKCFNYLDGGLTESIDMYNTLSKAQEELKTKNIHLKYFDVTFYKKGTCHITFTNEELLKKFNIFGSQHKGYLPPSYGKKRYEEMDQEEKSTIDEFEGKKEYDKVLSNVKYYIYDNNTMSLLECED